MSLAGTSLVPAGFRHEALFYETERAFLDGTVPFIRSALAAREPVLVMVGAARAAALRSALGPDGDAVRYADLDRVGCNPARIIPLWRELVDEQLAGRGGPRTVWGIGESVRSSCQPDELVECRRQEELLNVAFGDTRPGSFRLLCPYDVRALNEDALGVARRTHHHFVSDGVRSRSSDYLPSVGTLLDAPLPRPCTEPVTQQFDAPSLHDTRTLVSTEALAVGLGDEVASTMVLAVNELISNSIRYGGGGGTLRIWHDERSFFCEVRDRGTIVDPLVGCVRPSPYQLRGRGLWMVNQLCDVVQLRSSSEGTVVRVSMCRMPMTGCPPLPSGHRAAVQSGRRSSSGC